MLENGPQDLGVRTDFVWVPEDTRTNTLAQEDAGEWYIRLIELGPHIPPDAVQALLDKAEAYANANDLGYSPAAFHRMCLRIFTPA